MAIVVIPVQIQSDLRSQLLYIITLSQCTVVHGLVNRLFVVCMF
jgi:hypothetical protein